MDGILFVVGVQSGPASRGRLPMSATLVTHLLASFHPKQVPALVGEGMEGGPLCQKGAWEVIP